MMSAPRRERRIAHTYKVRNAHTHNVPSRRVPGQQASVRCTRPDCRKPRGPQA